MRSFAYGFSFPPLIRFHQWTLQTITTESGQVLSLKQYLLGPGAGARGRLMLLGEAYFNRLVNAFTYIEMFSTSASLEESEVSDLANVLKSTVTISDATAASILDVAESARGRMLERARKAATAHKNNTIALIMRSRKCSKEEAVRYYQVGRLRSLRPPKNTCIVYLSLPLILIIASKP